MSVVRVRGKSPSIRTLAGLLTTAIPVWVQHKSLEASIALSRAVQSSAPLPGIIVPSPATAMSARSQMPGQYNNV
jgi:hypothetical protein